MRLVINNEQFAITDEFIQTKFTSFFNWALDAYKSLDSTKRLMVQMTVRGGLARFAPTIQIIPQKGQDIVETLFEFIPSIVVEGFKDAIIQIDTSSENDTPTVTDFNFNLQSKS